MIKKASIVLLAAVLLLTLIVCFFRGEPSIHCYALYEQDPAILKTEGSAAFLYPGWSAGTAPFQKEDAIPEKTFSYQGTEYTASYRHSSYTGPLTFSVDTYVHKDPLIFTGFSSRTGELVSISWLSSKPELPLIKEDQIPEFEAIARQTVVEIFGITDIDAYTVERNIVNQTDIMFNFSRYLHGLPSSDAFTVWLDSSGSISDIKKYDVGMFTSKHKNALAIFAKADIDALIAATIPEGSEMYIEKIDLLQYALTPKGDVVLYAKVSYGHPETVHTYYYGDLIFALK